MSWSLFPAPTCDSVGANRCWEIPARAALKCCNDFSAVRLLRGAAGAVAAHSCRRLLVSLLHAASPRTNLDVTADYSNLDPHVSCVKTSHPAAQLDVNPEQRSVRQSMMSGPHRGDGAHVHTTFGTSRKFIRASSSRSGAAYCHQAPPLSVNVRTTASRPRRPCAEAEPTRPGRCCPTGPIRLRCWRSKGTPACPSPCRQWTCGGRRW